MGIMKELATDMVMKQAMSDKLAQHEHQQEVDRKQALRDERDAQKKAS